MNKLFYGDNLEVLRKYIKDETIDLCYIDPPFNSKRNYNQIYNNIGSDDKAQAQAFIDTWTWDDEAVKGFEQITENYNGVFTKQSIELIIGLEKVLGKGVLFAYLVSMTLRIAEIFRVLKPTGSFYLHCDPTASHYLKLILDSIFCAKGGDYKDEIIWKRSSGFKRVTAKKFPVKHDVLLFYVKSDDYYFKTQYIPHKPEYLKRFKPDSAGRLCRTDVNPTKGGTRTIFIDDVEGDIVDSVWFDIFPINPVARERLGYPTQKPESLLERIIYASSNEGDLILDAYCGCGTTISVAERLKRKWIGIDITYQSISLILKRLEDSFGKDIINNIELSGIPEDIKSAIAKANKKEDKTRKEFEKWVVLTYSNNRAMINEKKGSDGGIDGIAYMIDQNENHETTYKQVLFSVKSDLKPKVSQVRDFHGVIEREKAAFGYFITLYPPTRDMIAECKKIGTYHNNLIDRDYPKIEIITVQEMLDGARITIPASHKIDVVKSAKLKESEEKLDFGLF